MTCRATALHRGALGAVMLRCTLDWPHLERDHEFVTRWPISDEDRTLALIEADMGVDLRPEVDEDTQPWHPL